MAERIPRLQNIEISDILSSFFGTYRVAERGDDFKKQRKEQIKVLYADVWWILFVLCLAGLVIGFAVTLIVSGVWYLIDAVSIKEHFHMLSKILILYVGGGTAIGITLYAWLQAAWYLVKERKAQRDQKEQAFIDHPIHAYVATIMRVFERYHDRIRRWNLIAKAIDDGVLDFANGNQKEYEMLSDAREEIVRCLRAGEFLLELKKGGFADTDARFTDLLTDLQDAQAKLKTLFEVDFSGEIDVSMAMPELPDLGDGGLRLRRAGARAKAIATR